MARWLWAVFGILCVGTGIVGIVLPLVPTVPLMILAAFCFARSSDRLHDWLLSHRTFGPYIADWRSHGSIRPTAKRLATVSILLVFGVSLALGVRALVLGFQAAVLGAVLIFIWTRPNA
ncbi:DUF454 domain-containing protein [Maritimibacter sp. 55A14]|uniref:YbaN family protein n=1 Tax=Maritimibacter sp. 55A14 TaxID=2174844 RepID=UPI000D61B739|nr:YbaN family protein [Maritimibacter sp. 55A14]PWE33572.1 DUF454 domain-containing protein [Maritimibacter sp. 55A14]